MLFHQHFIRWLCEQRQAKNGAPYHIDDPYSRAHFMNRWVCIIALGKKFVALQKVIIGEKIVRFSTPGRKELYTRKTSRRYNRWSAFAEHWQTAISQKRISWAEERFRKWEGSPHPPYLLLLHLEIVLILRFDHFASHHPRSGRSPPPLSLITSSS